MSNIFTGLLSGVGNLASTAATDAANIGMADLNKAMGGGTSNVTTPTQSYVSTPAGTSTPNTAQQVANSPSLAQILENISPIDYAMIFGGIVVIVLILHHGRK